MYPISAAVAAKTCFELEKNIFQPGRKKDVISDWRTVPSFVISADDCLTFRSQRRRVEAGPDSNFERDR